ncbi:hypothetical protein HZA98_00475 [Candidatus Woesearchaeota archaeon]|nr:hypothetical protein [Candidatus Woesearchaeota archaeon]
MQEITKFQKVFGDSIRIKILEFYLESGDVGFPIDAVVEDKDIGKSQAYEVINNMKKENILLEERRNNQKRFYKLNNKNKVILELKKLFKNIITN